MLIKELLLSGRDWLAVMPRELFVAELRARRLQMLGELSESMLQPMGVVVRRRTDSADARYVALFVECLRHVSTAESLGAGTAPIEQESTEAARSFRKPLAQEQSAC